jgi:Spy/CpxP family protein refolding chaperone
LLFRRASNPFQQKEGEVMIKKKRTLIVIGIVVVTVLVGGWALAHGPWGKRGPGGPGYGREYLHSKLSQEQREKLQAQEQKFYEDTAELRREHHQKRLELRGLWIDPKADAEKIKAKEKELFDLQRRIQEKALEHRLAIRELLPEEGFGQGPWGYGYGMGYGPHHRRRYMEGPGSGRGYGGGLCW